MKHRLFEIIGILSLSFIICSTMAVSSGIPQMMEQFPSHSRASLEFLMSAPTIAILTMIALTPFLSRFVNEHALICLGLCLIGSAGVLPFFVQSYPAMLCSRLGLGMGIGLMNPHAVALVGEHFHGELRQRLQGIRCSIETLGEATLIFIAGQLLVLGWQYSYLIYLVSFIVLILYLCFVPKEMPKESADSLEETTEKRPLLMEEIKVIAFGAGLGFLLVAALTSVAMRMSSFVVSAGFGDAVQASTVLSLSIVSGFAGGICFGKLLECLNRLLLPVALIAVGSGLVIAAFSTSLLMVGLGTCLFGFFATVGLSYMFNSVSDRLPSDALTTGNAIVLVGCNLGAATSPFQLQFFDLFSSSLAFGFLGYAFFALLLAIGFFISNKKK